MKHGKYSKYKEVRPYKVTETALRYDGKAVREYFFNSKEQAEDFIEFMKKNIPPKNQYFYGIEYKLYFLGYEKIN